MIELPDGIHCFECTQDYGVQRRGAVVSHGHYDPMVLCSEHVKPSDRPTHPIGAPCVLCDPPDEATSS